MWTTQFCPNFSMCSFTFINVIIQIACWILTLIVSSGTDQGLNDNWFLGASMEALQKCGMRMPYAIKEDGQLWRLILSLYMSHGFS